MKSNLQWEIDCLKWRGKILRGPDCHWCYDWDELPISAATLEYDACVCYPKSRWGRIVHWIYMWQFKRKEKLERMN